MKKFGGVLSLGHWHALATSPNVQTQWVDGQTSIMRNIQQKMKTKQVANRIFPRYGLQGVGYQVEAWYSVKHSQRWYEQIDWYSWESKHVQTTNQMARYDRWLGPGIANALPSNLGRGIFYLKLLAMSFPFWLGHHVDMSCAWHRRTLVWSCTDMHCITYTVTTCMCQIDLMLRPMIGHDRGRENEQLHQTKSYKPIYLTV